jgi:hypothetical protein
LVYVTSLDQESLMVALQLRPSNKAGELIAYNYI